MFSGGLKLSDDDNDDFAVGNKSGISTLSNIFGVTIEGSQKKDVPSLRYVSPKQHMSLNPDIGTTSTKDAKTDTSHDWKVQVAKVVTAFKLLNQENISQGKIGLAILNNANEDVYRLILYRSKTNVLSTCTLKDNVTIYQNNLYLQFHDDLQLFWSILLESQDLNEVLAYIGSKVKVLDNEPSTTESDPEPISVEPPIAAENSNLEKKSNENSSDERLKATKANILSRMAKMGQALPKFQSAQATNTDVSDSSDAESKVKIVQKPIAATRKPKAQPLVPVAANSLQLVPTTTLTSIIATSRGHNPSLAVADSQYMNILLAENRTQNSELRMNISKLETKIERVLDKMDVLQNKSSQDRQDCKEDEILALEEKILELKKENRAQRLRIQQLEQIDTVSIVDSIRECNPAEGIAAIDTISDPVQRANVFRSSILKILSEQPSSSSLVPDTQVVQMEEEIQLLRTQLENIQSEKEEITIRLNELNPTVGFELPPGDFVGDPFINDRLSHIKQFSDSKTREEKYYKIICELYNILQQTRQSLESSVSNGQALTSQLVEQEKLFAELRTNHDGEIKNRQQQLDNMTKHEQSKTEQIVKEIMNNLYQRLSEQFDQSATFPATAVMKICAHAIKTETNNVIQKK